MTPAQRCDEIIKMIDEVLAASTSTASSGELAPLPRYRPRSVFGTDGARGPAVTALRIHHRGYRFFWDLVDLWRSAHRHTARFPIPLSRRR